MRTIATLVISSTVFLLASGCGGGGGGSGGTAPATSGVDTVTLAAGLTELAPIPSGHLNVDMARLGAPAFARVYELETPAGADFAFSIVARSEGNAGGTRLFVAHAAANGLVPAGGAESLPAAGLLLDAPGMGYDGIWVQVTGDGFARVTIRGAIQSDQILAVRVPTIQGNQFIGVLLHIGTASLINVLPSPALPQLPGMASTTLASSDSWQFGLPTIAVSGNRYSVAAYDGDAADPFDPERKRIWLQYDATAGTVTGGLAQSSSPDSGFWRDQEIAALGNVLAVVHTGDGAVRAEVSLDRGTTFPIQHAIDAGGVSFGQRLVQAQIGGDYTLACLYWRSSGVSPSIVSELVLVEAAPTAFDANNTPTGYDVLPEVVVTAAPGDVTPLLMDMEFSNAGDLAIAYGYTSSVTDWNAGTTLSTASFRCAVRLAGGVFSDAQIDSEVSVVPVDPSLAVRGSGPAMQIVCAIEKTDGIHVLRSDDAGLTFTPVAVTGRAGAMLPSVHLRESNGLVRLDVLFLDPTEYGFELHDLRWLDFASGAPILHHVTKAEGFPTAPPPYPGLPFGWRMTGVGWFGYDAVTYGTRIAVIVHEQTIDAYAVYSMLGGPLPPSSGGVGTGSGAATPPPLLLLPGMTGPVPPPNGADHNQLKLVVIQ